MNTRNIAKFLLAIIICQLAGVIGAIFTTPAISDWYATLQKPSFNPPNWVFGPVWTFLFLLMGISLYLILKERFYEKITRTGLLIFTSQLILNIFWSFLFFGLHNPFYAFVEVIVLWVFILLTICCFYKINKTASLLLVPYLLWVSFAMVLNFYIWRLNL